MQNPLLVKLFPWLLMLVGGVFGFLGYAGFDQFYLEWIFLVPLFWVIRNATPKRSFFLGWLLGTVGHAGGFYWIAHTLHEFAYMPWVIGVIGMVCLAAVNALSIALFAWATRRIIVETGWSVVWVAPVVYVTVENLYPFLFPNYLAASQYMLLPLTQIADVTGVLGITFLIVWGNATVYQVVHQLVTKQPFPTKPVAAFAAGLVVVVGYGLFRIQAVDAQIASEPKLTVGLVQTNIGAAQKHKNRSGFRMKHQQMSLELEQEHEVDLVVWPEGAYNGYLTRNLTTLPSRVLGRMKSAALFGALTRSQVDGESRKHNSVMLVDEQRTIKGIYDKQVLVPFGEYIPLGKTFPFIYRWSPYSGHYAAGESYEPLPFRDYRFSANVCYEDLFPGLIRDLMIRGKDSAKNPPHAIFNVTNDSWYGDTVEPMEHLVLASFRSIEHRRPLVRSTNTGISALVDPVGRLDKRTKQWHQEFLIGEVPMMTGRTVFSYLGNWFGWLATACALFALGQAFWLRRTGRGGKPSAKDKPQKAAPETGTEPAGKPADRAKPKGKRKKRKKK